VLRPVINARLKLAHELSPATPSTSGRVAPAARA
jgi:hypothetical protein